MSRRRCSLQWLHAYSPTLGRRRNRGEREGPMQNIIEFPVYQGGWRIGLLRVRLFAKLDGAVSIHTDFERRAEPDLVKAYAIAEQARRGIR